MFVIFAVFFVKLRAKCT